MLHRRIKLVLIFCLIAALACIFISCTNQNANTQETSEDPEAEVISVDFSKINTIAVENADSLENVGLNISEYKLSDIKLIITYYSYDEEEEVEPFSVPLKLNYVKAEDQALFKAVGVHTIHIIMGTHTAEFKLRLFTQAVEKYAVNFYDYNMVSLTTTQYIESGKFVQSVPNTPTREGYTFIGWSTNVNDDSVISNLNAYAISQVTNLYAKYRKNEFTVKYYYKLTEGDTGTLIEEKTIKYGESALSVAPEIPAIAGYSNGRWDAQDSMKSITSDNLSFYAIYDTTYVDVTFVYFANKDGEMGSRTYSWGVNKQNQGINSPYGSETSQTHVFDYWYIQKDYGYVKVNFPYVVNEEVTFYAKYISFKDGTNGLQYVYDDVTDSYLITGYEKIDTEKVVIPDTYTDMNTGIEKPVTGIVEGAFKDAEISNFYVSPNNTYFRVYENCLYDRNRTKLYAYPKNGTRDTNFKIADLTTKIYNYAFYNCKLETVDLTQTTNRLVSLGVGTFANCYNLTDIILPNEITEIPNYFLSGCINLASISLGDELLTIGDYALANLRSIKNLYIPSKLANIGKLALLNLESLETVSCSNNNTTFSVSSNVLYKKIGNNNYAELVLYPAKSQREQSTALTITESIQTVKAGAFSLNEVNSIRFRSEAINVTFEDESIQIPWLQSIFINNLATSFTLTFTKDVFKVSTFDTNEMISDKTHYFPKEIITSKQDDRFNNEYESTYLVENAKDYRSYSESGFVTIETTVGTKNGLAIVGYRGNSKNLIVPARINQLEIIKIDNYAFYQNNLIETVIVEEGILEIGSYALSNCDRLVEITLPNSLKILDDYALVNNTNLTTINYQNISFDEVGNYVLFNSAPSNNVDDNGLIEIGNLLLKASEYKLDTYDLPNDIKFIGTNAFVNSPILSFEGDIDRTDVHYCNNAFKDCLLLESIVPAITASGYDNCPKLNSTSAFGYEDEGKTILSSYNGESKVVVIPLTVEKILSEVFQGNQYLEEVYIYSSVKEIGRAAFYNCSNLVKVEFISLGEKDSISIGKGAFANCENLETIEFCKNVKKISYDAFYNTKFLNEYPTDSIIINNIFYKYTGQAVSYHILNTVLEINERAFYNNNATRNVYIPQTVEYIGDSAFMGSFVTNVYFDKSGSNLVEIDKSAFELCTLLKFIELNKLNKLETIGDNAFKEIGIDADEAISLKLPSNLKYLGKNAFLKANIQTLVFEKDSQLEVISEGAFELCHNLVNVVFNGANSLKTIDVGAFRKNNKLVIFENVFGEIESIGEEAFLDCTNLNTFNINTSKLTYMGVKAIEGTQIIEPEEGETMKFLGTILIKYTGLSKTVIIPQSTTIIDSNAFKNNIYVENIVFESTTTTPNSLKIIENGAFSGCTSLKSIVLPNLVEKIGDKAFENCTNLTSVQFNSNLKTIGQSAFKDCVNLESIELPFAFEELKDGAFVGCSNLTEANTVQDNNYISDNDVLYKYLGDNKAEIILLPASITTGSFEIPEKIVYKGIEIDVIGIGSYAFAYSKASEIVINDNIEYLGEYFVYNYTGQVIFPADSEKLESICNYAFCEYTGKDDQSHYYDIVIPKYILAIGENAFNGVYGKVTFEAGIEIEELGTYAFNNYKNTTPIVIPDSVKYLGSYAFSNCYFDAPLVITAAIEEIGEGCFAFDEFEIQFDANSQMDTLGAFSFIFYSYATADFVLPETITTIGDYAFMHSAINSLTISKSVTSIGEYAFSGVEYPIYFAIDSELEVINDYAFAYYMYDSITIPNTVTEIGDYAFVDSAIASINFTNQLEKIGESAFSGTFLTEVILPNSVEDIGYKAFSNISTLLTFKFESIVDSNLQVMGGDILDQCSNLQTLHLPFIGFELLDYASVPQIVNDLNFLDEYAMPFLGESFDSLTEVKLNKGVYIYNSFKNAPNITTLYFGSDCVIRTGVLSGLNSLVNITIPYADVFGKLYSGTTYLENSKMVPKTIKHVTININQSDSALADRAFYGCNVIESISLSDSIVSIGDNAFQGCTFLSDINISKYIEHIGQGAFFGCININDFDVDADNPYYAVYERVLYRYEVEEIDDGNIITNHYISKLVAVPVKKEGAYSIKFIKNATEYDCVEIYANAFYRSAITSLYIPSTVEIIGDNAFSDSLITVINIPSLTSYGKELFSKTNKLNKVYIADRSIYNSKEKNNLNMYCDYYYVSTDVYRDGDDNYVNKYYRKNNGFYKEFDDYYILFSNKTNITVTFSNNDDANGYLWIKKNNTGLFADDYEVVRGELKGVQGDTIELIVQGKDNSEYVFVGYIQDNAYIKYGIELTYELSATKQITCSYIRVIADNKQEYLCDNTSLGQEDTKISTILGFLDETNTNDKYMSLIYGDYYYSWIRENADEYKRTITQEMDNTFIYPQYIKDSETIIFMSGIKNIQEHMFDTFVENDYFAVTDLYITKDVEEIGNYAFVSCNQLATIYYEGTMEEWNAITKAEHWNQNLGSLVIHCADGDIV
ncbi:MAG: leucine-rich repeat protein [Clostridia bacterium]|nr:leucine-rich repeat protein [Clostridia bacterium]